MKNWLISLIILGVCAPVWGQNAVDQFKFISTMYTPVGSFKEVDTKAAKLVTEFKEGATFNVGSPASTGGTITVVGNPIFVEKFNMEDDSTVGSNSKWLLDTLRIYPDGRVKTAKFIANTVTLENSSYTTTAVPQGDSNLIINADAYTTAGSATKHLKAMKNIFHFDQNGEPENTAQMQKLSLSAHDNDANFAGSGKTYDAEKFYPIYTGEVSGSGVEPPTSKCHLEILPPTTQITCTFPVASNKDYYEAINAYPNAPVWAIVTAILPQSMCVDSSGYEWSYNNIYSCFSPDPGVTESQCAANSTCLAHYRSNGPNPPSPETICIDVLGPTSANRWPIPIVSGQNYCTNPYKFGSECHYVNFTPITWYQQSNGTTGDAAKLVMYKTVCED